MFLQLFLNSCKLYPKNGDFYCNKTYCKFVSIVKVLNIGYTLMHKLFGEDKANTRF